MNLNITLELPKDKCLYKMRTSEEVVIKNINETWNDGACRHCKCHGNNLSHHSHGKEIVRNLSLLIENVHT